MIHEPFFEVRYRHSGDIEYSVLAQFKELRKAQEAAQHWVKAGGVHSAWIYDSREEGRYHLPPYEAAPKAAKDGCPLSRDGERFELYGTGVKS